MESLNFYFAGKTGEAVAHLFPMWGEGRPLKVWAEHGLVKWEDTNTGEYRSMFWVDAAERTSALSDMVFNSHEQGYYCEETRRLQLFITKMENIIRRAKEQGSPEIKRRHVPMTKMTPIECELW